MHGGPSAAASRKPARDQSGRRRRSAPPILPVLPALGKRPAMPPAIERSEHRCSATAELGASAVLPLSHAVCGRGWRALARRVRAPPPGESQSRRYRTRHHRDHRTTSPPARRTSGGRERDDGVGNRRGTIPKIHRNWKLGLDPLTAFGRHHEDASIRRNPRRHARRRRLLGRQSRGTRSHRWSGARSFRDRNRGQGSRSAGARSYGAAVTPSTSASIRRPANRTAREMAAAR